MCRAQGSCVCRIVHCEVEPNCATSVRRVRTVLLSKPLSEGPLKPSIYQCALICRKGILIRLAASQTMQNAQRLKNQGDRLFTHIVSFVEILKRFSRSLICI